MANPTFTYNGHTYLLSDVLTWQEAQNQAVSLGGNLVTINDAAEQAWLAATFTASSWIGYTDQVTEGTFQWISGETASYTNWYPNEPNNSGNSENYAQMFSSGLWNDNNGGVLLAGIIEINSINNAPTLTTFSAPVNTGNQGGTVTVSFTDLQAKGDEADTDGTVDAFVVKAISSGTLHIGLSVATATPWDAVANNTVDATHQAYWTPDTNANGTLNAFTVVAKDNGGLESATPVQATIDITAPIINPPSQNHAPILTAPDAIHYTDTAFVDNFAPVTGSLLASDVDSGTTLTYGIVGGTGTDFITVSNAYGTLTVTTAMGAYSFVPDSAAMEALSADATSTFSVTVSDGQLTDSKTLVIDITQSGVTESIGNDNLIGTTSDDVFNGLAGNDIIRGLAGDDSINGGTGADRMIGGTGNDTYYVDNVGDKVVERAWQGIDTIYYSIFEPYQQGYTNTYTLPEHVENLVHKGGYNPIGIGNELDNILTITSGITTGGGRLYGLEGDDTLISYHGKDGGNTLVGGVGNDSYYVSAFHAVADVIIEYAGEGEDTVYLSSDRYTLADNVENLVFVSGGIAHESGFFATGTGNALDNHMTSNLTNTRLEGLGGDDNYYVGNEGAVIVELANDGWDSVLSTTNRTLEANVEELYLFGTDNINGFGNTQDNNLHGNASDNLLDGRTGADFMEGRAGNDTYYVDNAGDVVKERFNEGVDTVYSSLATYTLTANVENLSVNLERSATPVVTGIGNALDNYLTADGRMDISAHAVLEGRGGNDTLQSNIRSTSTLLGGEGNDLYYIYNVGDVVKEYANQGTDTVSSSLAAYTLTDNVENLILRNGPFGDVGISGTGNGLANHLTGDNANNILDGQAGDDTLVGGEGADTLIGGLGKDRYDLSETTAATDTVRIAKGDSLVSSYDVVTGFKLGNAVDTTGVDKLDLASTDIAADAVAVNGNNSGNIKSHHISAGIISFDDSNHYTNALTITDANLANVFSYLQANITGHDTVAFVSGADTYVFQDGGAVDTLVELVGVSAHSVNTTGLGAGALWIA
jgi:Ca2+-binding RTX toxin-like protein